MTGRSRLAARSFHPEMKRTCGLWLFRMAGAARLRVEVDGSPFVALAAMRNSCAFGALSSGLNDYSLNQGTCPQQECTELSTKALVV